MRPGGARVPMRPTSATTCRGVAHRDADRANVDLCRAHGATLARACQTSVVFRTAVALSFVVAALLSAPCAASAQADPRARALEERLVAPCCWTESLASHDSPLARELRAEIETRIAAGETAQSIQQDLLARHGERLRSAPPDLERVSLGLTALLGAAALGVFALGRRWHRRAGRVEDSPVSAPPSDAALDRRLEDELATLDT